MYVADKELAMLQMHVAAQTAIMEVTAVLLIASVPYQSIVQRVQVMEAVFHQIFASVPTDTLEKIVHIPFAMGSVPKTLQFVPDMEFATVRTTVYVNQDTLALSVI